MLIKVQITRQENADFFKKNISDIVEVEFEDYVSAVVASEIGNSHIEACKAQAVAARSFAISRGVLKGKVISDSSAIAQAYRAPRNDFGKYPNAVAGTKATCGEILTYGSKPISAVYSASNGGHTTSSKERWGSNYSYLPSQDDPWDAAFGKPKNGHGVGMSQNGAKYAASIGIGYQEILKFYYPGTEIKHEYGEEKIMNEKVQAIISLANSKIGDPYVYGARGDKCTPSIRKKYAGYNPSYHDKIYNACPVLSGSKSSCTGCKWENALCYDCRGFTYYVLKTAGGITLDGGGATSQYNSNLNWDKKGLISEMPNVVCCVFKHKDGKMSHTGLHIGNGTIIHCSTNVKFGKTTDAGWTHYAIPKGLYSKEEINNTEGVILKTTLRRGSSGEEVKVLQAALIDLGFGPLTIDGKFGEKTEFAVRRLQEKYGLQIDGIVGAKTWEIIDNATEKDVLKKDNNKLFESEYGYVPKDEYITIENKPIKLIYPAGEFITLSKEVVEDFAGKIQYALENNLSEISFAAPVRCEVELSAAGALNLYQQMEEKWK